jgi:hypothetical protein
MLKACNGWQREEKERDELISSLSLIRVVIMISSALASDFPPTP